MIHADTLEALEAFSRKSLTPLEALEHDGGMTITETPNTIRVTSEFTVSDEFLEDIITTAVEGGINYWAATSEYQWDGVPTSVYVHEMDEETGEYKEVGVFVDKSTILHSLDKIFTKASWINEPLLSAVFDDDAGEIDADLADTIMQHAVLGGQIYG